MKEHGRRGSADEHQCAGDPSPDLIILGGVGIALVAEQVVDSWRRRTSSPKSKPLDQEAGVQHPLPPFADATGAARLPGGRGGRRWR